MALTNASFTSPRIRDSLAALRQRTLELIVHGASLQDVLGALCGDHLVMVVGQLSHGSVNPR